MVEDNASPRTIGDWQALAARDPVAAAQTVVRRIRALPAAQQRAVFATRVDASALAAAFARVRRGTTPLAGAPYVLKDLFGDETGAPVRAGARFPPGVLPEEPGEGALPRALRAAGAVLVGRTQLPEFAYGLTGENPHYGDCEHPRVSGRTSGGSSSGTAVAVAAGIVPFGVGTDTGGSIRVPAAFCGLFGFRTTPRHAWIADAFPLAPSFDTAGWLAGTAADAAAVYHALIGTPAALAGPPRGCTLDFAALGVAADADVAEAFDRAAAAWAPAADPATRAVLAPAFARAGDTFSVVQSREAYAVHHAWLDGERARYDPAVWARIDRGRRWSPADVAAAETAHAAAVAAWRAFFSTWDFLVLPATPFPALAKAACTTEARGRLLALTAPASLAGLPVVSMPVALPSGLSTGLQIVVREAASPVVAWAFARAA